MQTRFITAIKVKKLSVLLPIREYEMILEQLENKAFKQVEKSHIEACMM